MKPKSLLVGIRTSPDLAVRAVDGRTLTRTVTPPMVEVTMLQHFRSGRAWPIKAASPLSMALVSYIPSAMVSLKMIVEAAKWNRMAAESGYVPAQSRLGAMYDEGRGLPRSLSKAMKWYRKAAQQGDLPAQISLGLIYGTGRGVPQNYFQAVKWFRLAAEQGDALAQYNLGLIYASGYDVVPKDDVQALVWFILAERGGNLDARKSHEAVATRMSPERVEKAEKFAQDWMNTKAQDKAAKCSMSGASKCR